MTANFHLSLRAGEFLASLGNGARLADAVVVMQVRSPSEHKALHLKLPRLRAVGGQEGTCLRPLMAPFIDPLAAKAVHEEGRANMTSEQRGERERLSGMLHNPGFAGVSTVARTVGL